WRSPRSSPRRAARGVAGATAGRTGAGPAAGPPSGRGRQRRVAEQPEEPAGDAKKKVMEARASVDVLLKAVGDTPIMRTKKWASFLKLMGLRFIYVNQSFAPSPDQEVGTLYECFGSDGKLVLHYCKTQAWG
uniref:Ubiquitin-like protein ATG12 n=1 Tax=Malurus cyaneus samueli TaxID=2593467 RepID=A0A8C5UBA8_9PASS